MAERRVLIVDDDEGIRVSLRFLFEDIGYVVEDAASGDAAEGIIAQNPAPRVVLLDRMMPGRDGAAVLASVTARAQWRTQLAILFMTARSDAPTSDLAALLAATTVGTIPKPFDLAQVMTAVDHAWEMLANSTL